ncbi:MAG: hypothetical protein WD670_10545 [Actinomycetota bacterium]
MLGDVGHPELVGFRPGEGASDEVAGRRYLVSGPAAAVAGKAFEPSSSHQHRNRVMPDGDATAHRELGVHPGRTLTCPVIKF